MKAKDFDKKFEDGGDITAHLDLNEARRPAQEIRRINVDVPNWMVTGLDREAARLGIPRQSVIKFWIAERLDEKSKPSV
jgi:hypothetical protein